MTEEDSVLTMERSIMSECKKHDGHTHQHGAKCGHVAIEHDGHVDYLHDGHLHHVHATMSTSTSWR